MTSYARFCVLPAFGKLRIMFPMIILWKSSVH